MTTLHICYGTTQENQQGNQQENQQVPTQGLYGIHEVASNRAFSQPSNCFEEFCLGMVVELSVELHLVEAAYDVCNLESLFTTITKVGCTTVDAGSNTSVEESRHLKRVVDSRSMTQLSLGWHPIHVMARRCS